MGLTVEQFVDRVYGAGVVLRPIVMKYGAEVSAHLHCGPDFLWSPDTNEYSQLPVCIQLFEETRVNQWKNPIHVDAGYRTVAHENELTKRGYQTAEFVSPHSVGSANDYKVVADTYQGTLPQGNTQLRSAFRMAATRLGLPQPRIGHKSYNESFIHVDYLFMLFAPYTKLPHPKDWTDLQDDMRQKYTLVLQPSWEW